MWVLAASQMEIPHGPQGTGAKQVVMPHLFVISTDKIISVSDAEPFDSDKDFGGKTFYFPPGFSVGIALVTASMVARFHLHSGCFPRSWLWALDWQHGYSQGSQIQGPALSPSGYKG